MRTHARLFISLAASDVVCTHGHMLLDLPALMRSCIHHISGPLVFYGHLCLYIWFAVMSFGVFLFHSHLLLFVASWGRGEVLFALRV